MMLDLYAEQINAARSQDVKPVNTRADVDPDNIVVKPLLGDILWDQGVPFNGMTPGQTRPDASPPPLLRSCATGGILTALSAPTAI